ncbi:MAG: hypothetical protein NDI60_10760 [Elusimicrobiales bacterium]|nr:hypothetical protein [Elusimicrobiales bacterium]
MAKLENQAMLVTALRAFTGALPPVYANEREFFVTSLLSMSEYLADLQKETLAEVCENFSRRLDAGKATPEAIDQFKAALDPLVSDEDFRLVGAGMAGSPAFIKQKLSGLRPVSAAGAAKKGSGLSPALERRIDGAYGRLNFPAIAAKVQASPDEATVEAALRKARAEVADYCCVYRIQIKPSDTLTPFSMAWVDLALAAGFVLSRNINRLTGRSL